MGVMPRASSYWDPNNKSNSRRGLGAVREASPSFSDVELLDASSLEITESDLEMAVIDLIRVAVTVKESQLVLPVARILKKLPGTRLVGRKNGYHLKKDMAPAQYRDLRIFLEMKFERCTWDSAFYKGMPVANQGSEGKAKTFSLLCEIQIMQERWTEARKLNSIQYKVRRAKTIDSLANDFKKYLVDGKAIATQIEEEDPNIADGNTVVLL